MNLCNSSEDDLKILVSKGYIKILNEDLVSLILDWNLHNYIRPDRKIDSIYKDLILQIEKRPRADAKTNKKEIMDGQWTDNGPQMDRIEENSIEENSIDKNINNVQILEQQFEELWNLYPRKQGKKNSYKYFENAIKKGSKYEDIKNGIINYNNYIKSNKIDIQYVQMGSTWFCGENWNSEYICKNTNNTNKNLKNLDNFCDNIQK